VLIRRGATIAYNFLPAAGWSSVSAAVKAKLRATYIITKGQE
jgi:hypothetical protein